MRGSGRYFDEGGGQPIALLFDPSTPFNLRAVREARAANGAGVTEKPVDVRTADIGVNIDRIFVENRYLCLIPGVENVHIGGHRTEIDPPLAENRAGVKLAADSERPRGIR